MKIYKLICKAYSYITYIIENLTIKKKIFSYSFKNKGIKKLNFNKEKLNIGKVEQIIKANKYHSRFIYKKKGIEIFLKKFFDEDLKKKISNLTGFNYSIDYFGVYKNFPILLNDREKGYYANHYHTDKPYSRNLIKVFIPLSKIRMVDGPLELINIKDSLDIEINNKYISSTKKYFFTGDKGDLLLCMPNLCLHKAGIPEEDNFTNLIMLQLNPSRTWRISNNLYERQYKIEPKFTSIINLFFKHTNI